MNEPVDFEIAIESTGFGLFNIMLLLIAIPSCLATVFESSTMSYVLPSAECDLKLNLLDKGMLNGITYAGMILSAIPWGFIADTKGRKNVLVLGYSINFVCVLGSALSQNLTSVMIFKFLGGFAICGPFAVLMAYMSEFHGIKYRSRVMMIIGMLFSIANLVLPALAWLILPNDWNFSYFNNFLVVHSWQVFLGVCSFPSFICAVTYTLFPESPKFLMAEGRNEEALNILSKVYSINCRKSKINYPISKLIEEVPQRINREDKTEQHKAKYNLSLHFLKRGQKQLKPLLFKPYVGYSFHIYAVQFCILLGLNTIRLWLPQLFTSIEEFKSLDDEKNGLCAILEHSVNKTKLINFESLSNCKIVSSQSQ